MVITNQIIQSKKVNNLILRNISNIFYDPWQNLNTVGTVNIEGNFAEINNYKVHQFIISEYFHDIWIRGENLSPPVPLGMNTVDLSF